MLDFSGIMLKIVSAIVLILMGFIIGKIFGRIVTLFFIEYDAATIFHKIGGAKVAFFLGGLASYLIYFFTVYVVLNQFGLRNITASIFAFFFILIVLASVVLGTRDFFENLLSHFTQKAHFKKGDTIMFSGIKGKVMQSDLIKIKVVSNEGDVFILPNAGMFDMDVKKVSNK